MNRIIAVALLVSIVFVVFAMLTMWLWNWLMPEIFGLPTIDFWQTCGLLCLTSLLFYRSK